jgi:hypothetical protein
MTDKERVLQIADVWRSNRIAVISDHQAVCDLMRIALSLLPPEPDPDAVEVRIAVAVCKDGQRKDIGVSSKAHNTKHAEANLMMTPTHKGIIVAHVPAVPVTPTVLGRVVEQ